MKQPREEGEVRAPGGDATARRRGPMLLAVALLLLLLFGLSLWLRGRTPSSQPTADAQLRRESDESAAHGGVSALPPPADGTETAAGLRDDAEEIGRRLVQRFPGDAAAMSVRARIEYRMGKSDAARTWWRKSLDVNAGHAPSYRGLAQIAADRGDYERAAELRQRVLDLEPTTQARSDLAEALLKLGEPRRVVALLEHLDREDPGSAWAFYLRGQAQLQLDDYDAAERSYAAALTLRPGWDVAYYGVITALARSGRSAETADYTQRFQASHAIERQMRQEVRANYDDVHLMRQELADVYTETGDVYAQRGALSEAEALWQRAVALDAENVTCRWRLASLYEQTRRDELAKQTLEDLVETRPDDVQSRLALGVLLARTGQLDDAEVAFRDAIRVAPQVSMGYQQLARLLLAANRDFDAARSAAEQALRLAPNAENYAVFGATLRVTGNVSGALAAFEQAMRLDPQNPDYPRIHASLRNEH